MPEKDNLLENIATNWKTYAWRALGGGIENHFVDHEGSWPARWW